MKKIILFILLMPVLLLAQPYILYNSSTLTPLSSGATFTGEVEKVDQNYNYLQITIKSDKSSAANGLVVRWSKTLTPRWETVDKRTYTANDSLNGANVYRFPLSGVYFRISYTNTNSAQTTFILSSYLINETKKFDPSGYQIISNASLDTLSARLSRALLSSLSTSNKQTGSAGGGYNKVTSTGGDSLLATESSWWRITLRAIDDTIAFSKTRTYPATDLNILYPGQSYTFAIPLDVLNVPKIYFKTYGVGTPLVQLKHDGR